MSEWQRRLPPIGEVRVRVTFRDHVDPKVLTHLIEALLSPEQRIQSAKADSKAS